jgi:hypothetical protein
MRTARALVLLVLVAVLPVCVFAASYRVGPPDPVGEKVYTSGQLERVAVPIAIVAGGLSLAWLLAKLHHKTRRLVPGNSGLHHG